MKTPDEIADIIASLKRAHRMSISDANVAEDATLYGQAAVALEQSAIQLRAAIYGQQIAASERDRLYSLIEDALPMLGAFSAYDVSPTQIENLHKILSRGVVIR